MRARNLFYGLYIVGMTTFFAIPQASANVSELLKMSEKLDQIDRQDLLTAIGNANECTRVRNFSCSEDQLRKAAKLTNGSEDKRALNTATQNLQIEKQHVSEEALAKAEQERQQQARQQQAKQQQAQLDAERQQAIAAQNRQNSGGLLASNPFAGALFKGAMGGLLDKQEREIASVVGNGIAGSAMRELNNATRESINKELQPQQREAASQSAENRYAGALLKGYAKGSMDKIDGLMANENAIAKSTMSGITNYVREGIDKETQPQRQPTNKQEEGNPVAGALFKGAMSGFLDNQDGMIASAAGNGVAASALHELNNATRENLGINNRYQPQQQAQADTAGSGASNSNNGVSNDVVAQRRAAAQKCKATSKQNTGDPQADTGCSIVAFDVCIYKSTGVTAYNQEAKIQCKILKETFGGRVCKTPCVEAASLPVN